MKIKRLVYAELMFDAENIFLSLRLFNFIDKLALP